MSLASDLLDQAIDLSGKEAKGAPKQASLRRAVSTAYYAIFHLLASDGAKAAAPANPPGLREQIQRAFSHGDMKKACSGIAQGNPSVDLKALIPQPSVDLVRIAAAFVELQAARHTADYDVSTKLSRTEVRLLLRQCRSAFQAWKRIRTTEEASVFLAALLFVQRWGR